MKKIIDGHKYDTNTAKKIGEESYNCSGDLDFCEEELFRTKSGMYFIHGCGGPQSRYAENVGQNEWAQGSRIIPLSEESAKEWAENALDADEYEAVFGEVEEDTAQISATITADVKSKLDKLKKGTGETTAEIIMRLIENETK